MRIEIFHNISRDAGFGLNTVFTAEGKRPAKIRPAKLTCRFCGRQIRIEGRRRDRTPAWATTDPRDGGPWYCQSDAAPQRYHEPAEDASAPDERHELVKVFVYEAEPAADRVSYSHDRLLADAFETFNVGSDEVAARYRARSLRSLSVGDVVVIDGNAYACASVGWDGPLPSGDLRVLEGQEAEAVIRERYQFRPDEPLAVTVPLEVQS